MPRRTARNRLRSYIDTQNAFGAKLRTHFDCTAEGSGEDMTGYKIAAFSVIE